jgi:hypothetical protein
MNNQTQGYDRSRAFKAEASTNDEQCHDRCLNYETVCVAVRDSESRIKSRDYDQRNRKT